MKDKYVYQSGEFAVSKSQCKTCQYYINGLKCQKYISINKDILINRNRCDFKIHVDSRRDKTCQE